MLSVCQRRIPNPPDSRSRVSATAWSSKSRSCDDADESDDTRACRTWTQSAPQAVPITPPPVSVVCILTSRILLAEGHAHSSTLRPPTRKIPKLRQDLQSPSDSTPAGSSLSVRGVNRCIVAFLGLPSSYVRTRPPGDYGTPLIRVFPWTTSGNMLVDCCRRGMFPVSCNSDTAYEGPVRYAMPSRQSTWHG